MVWATDKQLSIYRKKETMMKKALSLILVLALCLGLCACGGNNNKDAFTTSQEAFDKITTAYQATNEFSEDIYEAWFLGVNSSSKYNDDSELDEFADEMHIELEHIQQAIANLRGKDSYSYGDWSRLYYLYNYSYFSAWVSVISEAYKCSGKAESIRSELAEAKALMKTLSDKYSDYEHYPSLKKYFTNTLAFFDFCCNPEGSFEQVKDTFNGHRNNARVYFFDLNYIFSDSIGGMDEYMASKNQSAASDPDEASN